MIEAGLGVIADKLAADVGHTTLLSLSKITTAIASAVSLEVTATAAALDVLVEGGKLITKHIANFYQKLALDPPNLTIRLSPPRKLGY